MKMAIAASALICAGVGAAPLHMAVATQPLMVEAQRIGVNLGNWQSWGAAQLAANVLRNPGFEPVLDRAIVIVSRADAGGFADDTTWLARAQDFWRGAHYEVRTGVSATRSGRLARSDKTADRLPYYTTEGAAPPLAPGDVVVLTRFGDAEPAPMWWIEGQGAATSRDIRPGSPGVQSLSLAAPATVHAYLDTIGERAGKLLPIDGPWRLTFWSRATRGTPRLAIRFERKGSRPFVQRDDKVGSTWQRTVIEFTARDNGPAGSLDLALAATGDGAVLLDDVTLEAIPDAGQAFRSPVIAALRALHPGYLRDWQGQLGDSAANRLAEPFGRMPNRYRPGGRESVLFHYSLGELLALARKVGAMPWIVLPTTLADGEIAAIGDYLSQHAGRTEFAEVMVEFGNENWNATFRPAGLTGSRQHALLAQNAFVRLRRAAGPGVNLHAVVNGRFGDPAGSVALAREVSSADRVAVAPYFLYQLDGIATLDEALARAFAEPIAPLEQLGRSLPAGVRPASAEVNLHTSLGSAPATLRNAVVAGAASGPALARRLLDSMAAGTREQSVYTLAEYDNRAADGTYVRLWGITRDLAAATRLRPTGLAVQLLNRAITGAAHQVRCADQSECAGVTAMGFVADGKLQVAIVSGRQDAVDVELDVPGNIRLPAAGWLLSGDDAAASNEEGENVRIVRQELGARSQVLRLRVPPHSLVVALQAEAGR